MTKKTLVRWAISTALTFLGGFSMILLANIGDITLSSLKDGTFLGICFIATRQGIKLLLETFLFWYNSRNKK